MISDTNRKLVKIVYVVPHDEELAGQKEGLWAYPLGKQLYRLENIPLLAKHLNLDDVVRCKESFFAKPIIKELVGRSGNRKMYVNFSDETPDEICIGIIIELGHQNIRGEKVFDRKYTFNVPFSSDYAWVKKFLLAKQEDGLLLFREGSQW
jgi:hypothetical protein